MNTVKRGLIELTLSSEGGDLQLVNLFLYVQGCMGLSEVAGAAIARGNKKGGTRPPFSFFIQVG